MSAPVRITGVVVENFMRLTGCDLTFKGGALEIVLGRNRQGKTSLTRALEVALTGKAAEPPKVLHGDASFARVTIFTNSDLIVDRTWKLERNGTIKRHLVITGAPGHAPGERVTKSAETLLKSLWAAAGAVDPAAFLELGSTPAGRREQGAILRKVAGLDWEELDREKADVYAHRATVNKAVSDLEGLLRDVELEFPAHQQAPAEPVKISALTAKLQLQLAHNKKETDLKRALESAQKREGALAVCEAQLGVLSEAKATVFEARAPIAGLEQRVAELEQQLAEARRKLSDAEHVRQSAVSAANTAHRELLAAVGEAGLDQQLAWDEEKLTAALGPAQAAAGRAVEQAETALAAFRPEDDKATLAEIEGAEEVNRRVEGHAKRLETKQKLEQQRQEAAQLTRRLTEIQAEKESQLAEADLPDGLGFDEDGITIDGMPIENASHAQQYEAAISVAFLQAAHIGLVIVRDDRLDEESMAVLQRRAEAKGVQVFIERVARRPEDRQACTVFVEDGTAEVVS